MHLLGGPWSHDQAVGAGVGGGGSRGSGVWPCTSRSNTSWVMVTWGPPVDKQTPLMYLMLWMLVVTAGSCKAEDLSGSQSLHLSSEATNLAPLPSEHSLLSLYAIYLCKGKKSGPDWYGGRFHITYQLHHSIRLQ